MALHGNWIKFKGIKKERGFNRHHITINHVGQSRPRAVTLYFEPVLNKIAVQPADARDPGSVPLIAKTFGAHYVPAAQFVRENRIHIAGTQAFIKPELNHNGIMFLDLNEVIPVGRGRNPGLGWKPHPREHPLDLEEKGIS